MVQSNPKSGSVVLEIRRTQLSGEIADLLEQVILESGPGSPIAAWIEPAVCDPFNFRQFAVPGTQSFPGFLSKPGLAEMAAWIRNAHLTECRIFYPNAVLHLLDDRGTWQAVLASERDSLLPGSVRTLTQVAPKSDAFDRIDEPVFVCTGPKSREQWTMVRYHNPGDQAILFWRIIHE